MKILITLMFGICLVHSSSGSDPFIGMRSITSSLNGGGIYKHGLHGLFGNSASVVGIRGMGISLYAAKAYLLPGINEGGIGCFSEVANGTAGLSLVHFGVSKAYNNTKASMFFAKKIGSLNAGIRLGFQQINIPNYIHIRYASIEIGFISSLSDHLELGSLIRYSGGKTQSSNASFALGIGYHPANFLLLGVEVSKEISERTVFIIGIEYAYTPQLKIRAGISINPVISAFGLRWSFSSKISKKDYSPSIQNELSIASNFHQKLGLSPVALFNYVFKEKSN